MALARFTVSGSAGQVNGRRFAVLDNRDKQGGKGTKRVSFHRTFEQAQKEARRLNGECVHCGVAGHSPTCPLRRFERDPEFGSAYDESEGQS